MRSRVRIPAPRLIIDVKADLSGLTVLAESGEQETILGAARGSLEPWPVWTCPDPVLMTDTARIGALAPGLRDAVHALYSTYPRTVRFDGVEVSWSPNVYPRVWCPSIDTVFFARALKPYAAAASSVAEIGCGSGFLTKYALTHGTSITRAVASDINLDALACARDALAGLSHSASVSLVCPQPDDPTIGFAGSFDVIFCNPPYIPRPGMRNDNPYEGLDLIAKLARQGRSMLADGGVLLLNISSLSGAEPERWLAENGWAVRELDRLTVPLKVNAVTSGVTPESRSWLEYLRERGLVPGREGYEYWHDLRMLECVPT
ncbi:class I SAM-dependent methyltransferase [Solirubrobacter phytolaccae]|uniref:Class I SAM-dependent methyltransferase n=1 Tax=Solirubrobacter phytolaccae TaxID=1404360 RepID=A0A9X3S6H4_9ACTN|nr:class I SAM-dependent methyltransferase [Solirubrobacter phytolaccae]MDA0179929.1 class I SAM-dependent methyltransferase [Solirubrobacter phytolaccae]